LRQRGLAEAGRTDEQHVVERLAPPFRRLDEHLEVGAHGGLADELVERLRPQRAVGILAALLGRYEAGGEAHASSSMEGIRRAARRSKVTVRVQPIFSADHAIK